MSQENVCNVTEYDNVVLKNGLESPTMESRRKM